MNSFYFSQRTWPQLKEMIERRAIVLLPIGTVEEHGKHLPVNADEEIATQVSRRVAERMSESLPLLVMPTIWAGYSMSIMQRWPGTIRVRTRILADLVFDVVKSLTDMGFEKIMVVNAHGHHPGILEMVAREIADATGGRMFRASDPRSLEEIFHFIGSEYSDKLLVLCLP